MGYSLSWLAIKGKLPQTVLDELGFRVTEEGEAMPESDLTAAELPNGWYLIVANRSEQVVPDGVLKQLSAGCEAVTCFVEEHVMFSSATGWKDGRRCWLVRHNAQKQRDHIEAEGELAPMFNSILSRMQSRQREADARKQRVDFLFEVPVELAHALVGYRCDRDVPELRGKPFRVLVGGGSTGWLPPPRFSGWPKDGWHWLAGSAACLGRSPSWLRSSSSFAGLPFS